MRIFATAVILVVLPACCFAQDPTPKAADQIGAQKAALEDLSMRKKNLLTESGDLESIEKSLATSEFNTATAIHRNAEAGVMYLDATYWFVGIYDRMQCEDDRNLAKAVLQNRLGFYSHMLDLAVDSINGHLGLSRVPAVAQQGQQIRDELRQAKVKLDDIAASLK
jgi:hypothetical protein